MSDEDYEVLIEQLRRRDNQIELLNSAGKQVRVECEELRKKLTVTELEHQRTLTRLVLELKSSQQEASDLGKFNLHLQRQEASSRERMEKLERALENLLLDFTRMVSDPRDRHFLNRVQQRAAYKEAMLVYAEHTITSQNPAQKPIAEKEISTD